VARASREEIYQALFNLGAAAKVRNARDQLVPAFKTTSRRWRHWNEVPADQQPAFYQVQRKENPRTQERVGMPPRWVLYVDWFIYANAGSDITQVTSSILNPILDAIEAALPYNPVTGPMGVPLDYQRLGFPPGSIQEARIMDEDIEINEGLLAPQSQTVAVVPVRIIRT
jgi:hypothetical protein